VNANGSVLDVLGDSTRRAIFERLSGGPLSVGELAEGLPVSRPAVSQHLRVLKDAGLVSDRKEGTRRLYRVDPGGLAELRDYFDSFWGEALERFAAEARKEQE
jgi:DNA-binding transcriptional ArsR family regulator